MGLNLEFTNGQTPLEEEEKEGVLIETISTRGELDEFEQQNIEEAMLWVLSSSIKPETVFTEFYIKRLHKKMYNKVWKWAGEFRKTDKNLGIDKWQISTALKALCDDAIFWVENETYSPEEIAIRFKHRIVCIHCFPNGNGRHSRLIADIIITKIFKEKTFTWGAANIVKHGDARARYIVALKEADKGDFNKLLKFARS